MLILLLCHSHGYPLCSNAPVQEIEQQRLDRAAELRLLEGVDAFCTSIRDAMVTPSFEVKQKVLQLVVQRIVGEDHRITIEHVVPSGPIRLQPEHHAPADPPWAHWLGTVYHGLPADLYTFRETPGTYLAFLGRIAPEKGVEQAIAIAQQVGMPLKMAAKVDPKDRAYFREVVQPLLHQTALVDYISEVGGATKDAFLGEAAALLFPIDWPEPFGLVMIEAMACGTPVIAYPRGSVPEVLEDGVTGWIVEGMEEAVQAVVRVPALSRARCRRVFEERFSASRMAQDYVQLYRQCLAPRAGHAAA